jgi:hypothetical protein
LVKFIGKISKRVKLLLVTIIFFLFTIMGIVLYTFDNSIVDFVAVLFCLFGIGMAILSTGYTLIIEDDRLYVHLKFWSYFRGYRLCDIINVSQIYSWYPIYLIQVKGKIRYLYEIEEMNRFFQLLQKENPGIIFDDLVKRKF